MVRPEVTGRKFSNKRALAIRYGVVPRTIDRWVKAKILPPPDLTINNRDYWYDARIDAHDHASTAARAAAKGLPVAHEHEDQEPQSAT
jgi:hypothetical protein